MTEFENLVAAVADRYTIERELGEGGMATVYYAKDLRHDRMVALKVLHPDLALALGPDRFLREIRITAGLAHPHVLPLLDSGDANGFLFYVMPYVSGESLRDRLNRDKQLSVADALQVAREVADALSFAHSQGIIHRDIKPDNILFQAGHAMVADFGIARALSAAGGEQLTATGLTVGTPGYMSPEQASGEAELDGRSDLYSLACVVYEMLAGQPPFTGATVESVIRQHLTVDPPPITQFRPAVPAAVSDALTRALSKAPADRFSPVVHFAEALQVGAAPVTAAAPTTAPARPGMGPYILAVVAVVVVVLSGLAIRSIRTSGAGATPSDDVPSIAVLPFADLSGGGSEYLGDGIAETLINALSRLEGLRVAARTSAFSFKGRSEDVRAIAASLNVSAVLEGSVQQAGGRIRVTAQLINAADGFHLWSQNFDRDVSDVFAVQDAVARAVVSALKVELLGDREAPIVRQGTDDVAAYNAYLQGRYFWNKRTPQDLERSATFLERAVAIDSNFARAWAGLADAYALFGPSEYDVRSIPWAEAHRRGEAAARRALALDPNLAEAHTSLASLLEQRWAIDDALAAYERAIELDPNYPTGRQWYSGLLARIGRVDEALEQMLIAERLDPLSVIIAAEVGEMYDAAGRTAEAQAQYDRLLQLYPESFAVAYFAGTHMLIVKDFDRAASLLAQVGVGFWGDTVGMNRFASGVRDPATRVATLRAVADTAKDVSLAAAIYRALDDDESAILAIVRGVDSSPDYVYVPGVRAMLGPVLTADPRVQAAIQRLREKMAREAGTR